ncbi:MAG: hypothetical protein QXY08_03985 [Nitrososphaerales archaeon]
MKPLLAFELEPPSLLNYLFRDACLESRSEEEFVREAELVLGYLDLIRIAEALPEQPYLSSLTALSILRSNLRDVKAMCSIRATEMNLNALIQHIGEALVKRCDYLVLEGTLEDNKDMGSVIQAFNAVKNLGLLEQIKVGLEVYLHNKKIVDECIKARPSFIILRVLDIDSLEDEQIEEAGLPTFIRIPMVDLTGLGLMASKAIERIAEGISKILTQNLNVILAAPHGFDEGFEVLKRVRR